MSAQTLFQMETLRSVKGRSIAGGPHSAAMKKDEWLTPPHILASLGKFDLDPCAPVTRPWPTAAQHYTIFDNGLSKPWAGRVWMNPPYGTQTGKWMKRLVDHGNGIALIFARTETEFFFPWVWEHADSLLFLKGRLHFCDVQGKPAKDNAGGPSVLVAYGKDNSEALANCGLAGKLVRVR